MFGKLAYGFPADYKRQMMNEEHSKVHHELIFVVFDGREGGYVAVEGNIGLVAMGDDDDKLQEAVCQEVNSYYKGTFEGTISIRRFVDKIVG
ncbi:MAG: hypothetical protein EAS52_15720 [Parapedobacter sp.]|nr:MAG: hypothetical protein EAS52_15720 [Parapedobacter sp.]